MAVVVRGAVVAVVMKGAVVVVVVEGAAVVVWFFFDTDASGRY